MLWLGREGWIDVLHWTAQRQSSRAHSVIARPLQRPVERLKQQRRCDAIQHTLALLTFTKPPYRGSADCFQQAAMIEGRRRAERSLREAMSVSSSRVSGQKLAIA